MNKPIFKSHLSMIVVLGSVWGLSEAALGMGLRSCAASVSGSIMTGVALFFMAAGWAVSKRAVAVFFMVLIAAFFKMFDALLLSLPLNHGAIGNPIFAFVMEAIAFVVIISMLKEKMAKRPGGQALLGGLAAVLAVNLFPLVKFATGVPACLAPGTAYPLSLYYIHFAVLTSLMSVPLGFFVGEKIEVLQSQWVRTQSMRKLNIVLSPAVLILCLVIITLLRLT